MPYKITDYTKQQAKKLGVTVKPSTVSGKKIDVFKGTDKLASIGGSGYLDYPTYLEKNGKAFADERRRLYKVRHSKDRSKVGTPGYFADKLLW